MRRPPAKRGATILYHPAPLFRAWMIERTKEGQWVGVLRSLQHGFEARTEIGAEYLVREAIHHAPRYRGVPVALGLGSKTGVPF